MKLHHIADEQRRKERAQQRFDAICATMPAAAPIDQTWAWRRYVWMVVNQLGKQALKTVYWPWNDREHTERTTRGKTRQPRSTVSRPAHRPAKIIS